MIGFGLVATALLEIFNLEKAFKKIDFIVIEPENIKIDLFNGRKYNHIKEYLTEDNIDELLDGLDNESLVIDLTVETDSIMIIKKCKESGALYINTSVENWEDFDEANRKIDTYEDIRKNTLYYRQLEIEKLLKNTRKTRIINFGMNPGGISEIAKYTIREFANRKNKKLIGGDYARLCNDLDIKKLIITEYDDTQTNIRNRFSNEELKNMFINDWSPLGLTSEGLDNVMMSLNKEDESKLLEDGYKLIKPTDGTKNSRIFFLPKRGIDTTDSSVIYGCDGEPSTFEGYLIPHAEIISMSNFLNYNNDSPTIYYVYRPCDDALESIEKVRENNYKPLKNYYSIEKKDVINNCCDSIGVLLVCSDGTHFYGGVSLTMDDINKLGIEYSTPTTIQVGGWIFATIKYILSNPNIGLNEAETLKSRELMKIAKKYTGELIFRSYKY